MRRRIALFVVIAATAGLTGCGDRTDDQDRLADMLGATSALAHRFSYEELADDRQLMVQGAVADDFRYKAEIAVDGRATLRQVVIDDAVAVQLVEPSALGELIDKETARSADLSTDAEGVSLLDALRARRWVLDESGAPPSVVGADRLFDFGADPVLDARTVLDYVDSVVRVSEGLVERFKPDDITPKIRESEDVFPKPDEGAGITRYDIGPAPLPSVAQATSSQPSFPSDRHFRRMVVYVEDGHVVRVDEQIAMTPRQQEEFDEYAYAVLREANGRDFADQYRETYRKTPEGEREAFLFGVLNTLLELAGEDPIRPRTMSFQLQHIGAEVTVDLPGDVIRGSLAVLKNLGRKPADAGGDAADPRADAASDL